MSTLEAIIVLIIMGTIIKKTWIGKTLIMIIRSCINLFKSIYFGSLWIYRMSCNLNNKMKQKANASKQKPNASDSKVISMNKYQKAK